VQLVTLSRAVSFAEKDSLFDFLMARGAIVKQVRMLSQHDYNG